MQDRIPERDNCGSGASRQNRESLLERQGLRRDAQDPFTEPQEGDDQQYLRGGHGCLNDLYRRQVQSKRQCDRGTENGRDAENGYIADHHADRHAKREAIRGYALGQQGQEGFKNSVAQPVLHGDIQRFRAERIADAS